MFNQTVVLDSALSDEVISQRLQSVAQAKDSRGVFGLLAGEEPATQFIGVVQSNSATLTRAPEPKPHGLQNNLRIQVCWEQGRVKVTQKSPVGVQLVTVMGCVVVVMTLAAGALAGDWGEPVVFLAAGLLALALQRTSFSRGCHSNLEIITALVSPEGEVSLETSSESSGEP